MASFEEFWKRHRREYLIGRDGETSLNHMIHRLAERIWDVRQAEIDLLLGELRRVDAEAEARRG